MEAWNDMGWPARITLLLCLTPIVAGTFYAARPTLRRFAVTKALSIAALAGGIGSTVFGVIALLQNIGERSDLSNSAPLSSARFSGPTQPRSRGSPLDPFSEPAAHTD